jgi:hypothetical protein
MSTQRENMSRPREIFRAAFLLTKARTVAARSAAEMPVVVSAM